MAILSVVFGHIVLLSLALMFNILIAMFDYRNTIHILIALLSCALVVMCSICARLALKIGKLKTATEEELHDAERGSQSSASTHSDEDTQSGAHSDEDTEASTDYDEESVEAGSHDSVNCDTSVSNESEDVVSALLDLGCERRHAPLATTVTPVDVEELTVKDSAAFANAVAEALEALAPKAPEPDTVA
jgi:hypothetical protein